MIRLYVLVLLVVSFLVKGQEGPVEYDLSYGRPGTLCTLVHIKHADPTNTTKITTISNNSPGSDYTVTPVGRSYGNKSRKHRIWEDVPGKYQGNFELISAEKTYCRVRFKETDNIGSYFLITFGYNPTSFDKLLSRFFMQTTFGPTKALLSEFANSYSQDDAGMINWVKDQMDVDTFPPTKHREYFRKKADYVTFNNEIGFSNVEVQHPCVGYSRWRDYAFNSDDAQKAFDVYYMGPAQFLVVIDGIARTVMTDFRSTDQLYQGAGFYEFSKYRSC